MNATATAASWPMACGKNTGCGVPTTASTVMTESRRKATLSQIGGRESAPTISRTVMTGTDMVTFLTRPEIDALLAAVDRNSWTGRRDHALLVVAVQTGLRVSELLGLHRINVVLGHGAHVRVHGKGRKERVTPLTSQTVVVLRAWLDERGGGPAKRSLSWTVGKHARP